MSDDDIPASRAIVGAQLAANNALLDIVATRCGARFDVQLAAILRISPPTLSKIRNGYLGIGASLQIAILEYGFVSLAELRQYVPRPTPAVRP